MVANEPDDKIQLLVVDDDPPVREALSSFFSGADGVAEVAVAAGGAEALAYASQHDLDVALVDVRMPGMDGVETTRRLLACRPSLKVVGLTTFSVADYGRLMAEAGASGILHKDVDAASLLRAVLLVHAGVAVVSEPFSDPGGFSTMAGGVLASAVLTTQERAVLGVACQGATNREVAARLNLAESTVKGYMSTLMTKLDCSNRIRLILRAFELGLVNSPSSSMFGAARPGSVGFPPVDS